MVIGPGFASSYGLIGSSAARASHHRAAGLYASFRKISMHRIFAALLAAVSCVAVAQAQDPVASQPNGGATLTLDQAVVAAGGSAPAADAAQAGVAAAERSAERRVGKECVSTC